MKLLEILKQTYPWEFVADSSGELRYTFVAGDNSIINVYFFEYGADRWAWNYFYDKNFVPVELEFSRETAGLSFPGTVELTGEGDAFKIYATIVEIIKDYMRKNKFDVLFFSAIGKSRQSLYLKILKKFANKFGFSFVNYGENYYIGKNLNKHMENIKLLDQHV